MAAVVGCVDHVLQVPLKGTDAALAGRVFGFEVLYIPFEGKEADIPAAIVLLEQLNPLVLFGELSSCSDTSFFLLCFEGTHVRFEV